MKIFLGFLLAPLAGGIAVSSVLALILREPEILGVVAAITGMYGYFVVVVVGVPAFFVLRAWNMLEMRHCLVVGSVAGALIPVLLHSLLYFMQEPQLRDQGLLLEAARTVALGVALGSASAWFFWLIALRGGSGATRGKA